MDLWPATKDYGVRNPGWHSTIALTAKISKLIL